MKRHGQKERSWKKKRRARMKESRRKPKKDKDGNGGTGKHVKTKKYGPVECNYT